MPQQNRFVTRALPDQIQASVRSYSRYPLVSLLCLPQLIPVQYDKSSLVSAMAVGTLCGSRRRAFDERKRIATTRLQQDCVKMRRNSRRFQETREQCDITLLAFTFRADEEFPPLWNQPARAPHPICGTAP